jgi:hypothetical protein
MSSEPQKSSIFPRTDWAGLSKTGDADTARLDGLIRLYWKPLKIYFDATFPSLKGDSETILLEFAEDKMLKAGWLQGASQSRGRFRNFLKTSLRHFVLDRLDKVAVKRAPVSLEELVHEVPETTEDGFELAWFKTVLDETLRRMEADCRNPAEEQPRRTYIWEIFRLRLLEPMMDGAPEMPYEQLVEKFDLKSPSEAFNTLASGKRIFKTHLTRVIQEYAGQDEAAKAELDALDGLLSKLLKRK